LRIDHIALNVNDLEQAKTFFEKYFSAHAEAYYFNPDTKLQTYFLHFSDGARLELMNRPALSEREQSFLTAGYLHLAFSVGSKEKVDTLTQQLKDGGYAVLSGPRTTGDGYYESCVAGFEGNLIEITV